MAWFSRFLTATSAAAAVSRRRFFAGAGGVAAGLLLADDADARAPEPGAPVEGPGASPGRAGRGVSPFVGEISIFAGNFPPRGWAFCDGQLLPISQNTEELYSILGTTYGGNGVSTFALPDLRGRAPMHPGQGPGLTLRDLGEQGGSEAVPVPPHTHSLPTSEVRGPGAPTAGVTVGGSRGVVETTAAGTAGQTNLQPYIAVNFIIALQGISPPLP